MHYKVPLVCAVHHSSVCWVSVLEQGQRKACAHAREGAEEKERKINRTKSCLQ